MSSHWCNFLGACAYLLGIPSPARFQHRIQDCQQFSHTSHQRHFLGFAACQQLLIGHFQHGIVPHCHKCFHVQHLWQCGTTAEHPAFATHSIFVVERSRPELMPQFALRLIVPVLAASLTRSAMMRPTPGTLNSSFWCCRHSCDCCTCCSISASNSCSCSLSHSMCRSTLDCFCSRFATFGGLTAFEELEFASVLDRATQTAEYLIL